MAPIEPFILWGRTVVREVEPERWEDMKGMGNKQVGEKTGSRDGERKILLSFLP